MQRTRLNTLLNQIVLKFRQWAFNPWRRLSLIIISLLFGNFFATAISATAGQTAKLDVTISAFLVLGVELISWLYYRFTPRRQFAGQRTGQQTGAANADILNTNIANTNAAMPIGTENGPVQSRSTLAESLNAFKLGMIYGLFVEAFKLGS